MSISNIDENGFNLELFEDRITRYKDLYRESFGAEIDLSDESIAYNILLIDAYQFQQVDDVIQDLFSSISPDQAEGPALDFVASFSATERLQELPTVVTAQCIGVDNTFIDISSDKKAQMTEGQFTFTLRDSITIAKENAVACWFKVPTVADSTLYSIDIGSITFSYTSDASATEQEIIIGLRDEINAGSLNVTASQDGNYLKWLSDDFTTSFETSPSTSNLSIYEVATNGIFDADVSGPTIVSSTKLDTIVTPVTGWNSVVNQLPGVTGRNTETDDELRARRNSNVQTSQTATDLGIEKRILQNIDGVTKCFIIPNRELTTDGEGQPGKTFQAVVVGGDEDDIIKQIYLSQPSGIKSHGSSSGTYIDKYGYGQTIKYSRPENIYIWYNVEVEIDSLIFPSNGIDLINNAIVAEGATIFDVGDNVLWQKLFDVVFDIDGVTKITEFSLASKTVTTPDPAYPGDYAEDNITISRTQVSVFSVDRGSVATV